MAERALSDAATSGYSSFNPAQADPFSGVLEQVFFCIRTGCQLDTDWASAEMDLAGGAAALIRQQVRDIDELWGRLSRAYLAVRAECRRWRTL